MAAMHGDEGGSMDISEHRKTWAGFVRLIEVSLALIAAAMFLMLIFRTNG